MRHRFSLSFGTASLRFQHQYQRYSTTAAAAATSAATTPPVTPSVDITSLLINLNELSSKQNITDDVRNQGRRLLSNIESAIDLESGAVVPSNVTTGLLRGLGAFDPNAEQTKIIKYVEKSAWASDPASWSSSDLVAAAKAANLIQGTPIVEVLVSLLWPYIQAVPKMDASDLAVVSKVFAANGIVHPELSAAIVKRTGELVAEASVDELSRILVACLPSAQKGPEITTLVNALCDKIKDTADMLSAGAVARCAKVLSQSDVKPEPIQELLQKRALDIVAAAPLADTVEMVKHFANLRSKEAFTEMLGPMSDRLSFMKAQLSPQHITTICAAIKKHGVFNENLMSTLAERACKIMPQFEMEELATLVSTLAGFDLYDPELFPLVSGRIQHITRQKMLIDPEHVTAILTAFAKLKEKNENILYSAAVQYKMSLHKLPKGLIEDGLAAFKTFNFNYRDIVGQMQLRLTSL